MHQVPAPIIRDNILTEPTTSRPTTMLRRRRVAPLCRPRPALPVLSVLLAAALSSATPFPESAAASETGGYQVAAVRPMDAVAEPGSETTRKQLEDALRALKHSKNAGRLEAEQALASIDAFREARRTRKPPQPLDGDLPQCLAVPTPDCLLQEALGHAYRVPDQGRRDWALSAIAAAYYETGAHQRIYSVIALMDDPRTALRLLEQTIGSDNGPAAAMVREPEDLAAGGDDSAAGWIPSAEVGDWPSARKSVKAIAEPRYRAVAWARLARRAIDAGETALAEEALRNCESLIAEIEFSYARSYARYEASLTHIARVARANGGDVETADAAESAAKIEQPHFRADAFWRLANVGSQARASVIQARAEESFTEIASRLRKVFVLTAEEVISEQRKTRALAIATTIQDPLDRARAFTRIARYVR